jgi:ERCC4-type nuclease
MVMNLKRAINSIKAFPRRLVNGADAKQVKYVGDTIAEIIDRYLPYYPAEGDARPGLSEQIANRFRESLAEAMESDSDEEAHYAPPRGNPLASPVQAKVTAASPLARSIDSNSSVGTPYRPKPSASAHSSPSSQSSAAHSLPGASPLNSPPGMTGSRSLPPSPPQRHRAATGIPLNHIDRLPGRQTETQYAYDDSARIRRKHDKPYLPKIGTGNWAIMITLFLSAGNGGSMEEDVLRNKAETYSNEPMWGNKRNVYSAFSNVPRLIEAGYLGVLLDPRRYYLTPLGEELAKQFYADSAFATPTHPTHSAASPEKEVPDDIFAATGPNYHPTYVPPAVLPQASSLLPTQTLCSSSIASPPRAGSHSTVDTARGYASARNTEIREPIPIDVANDAEGSTSPGKKKRGRPKKNAAAPQAPEPNGPQEPGRIVSSQSSLSSAYASYPSSPLSTTQPIPIELSDDLEDDPLMSSPPSKRPKLSAAQSSSSLPPSAHAAPSSVPIPQATSPVRHVSSPEIAHGAHTNAQGARQNYGAVRTATLANGAVPQTNVLNPVRGPIVVSEESRTAPSTPAKASKPARGRAVATALDALATPSRAPIIANDPSTARNGRFQPPWRREVYHPPNPDGLTTFVREPGFDRVSPAFRAEVPVQASVSNLEMVPLDEAHVRAPLKAHRIQSVVLFVDTNEMRLRREKNADYFQNALEDGGVQVRTHSLALGDFLWVGLDSQGTAIVLDSLIERKTVDDLGESIIDGRYVNQKWRIRHSGLTRCFYLIEGTIDHTIKNYSVSVASLLQAQAKVAYGEPRLKLLRTKDQRDSVKYIDALTKIMEAQFIGQIVYTTSDAAIETLKVRHHGITNFERFERCTIDDSNLCWTLEQFQIYFQKTKTLHGIDLFGIQMSSFYGSNPQIAAAIVSVWKSLPNLLAAIDMANDTEERYSLLSSIEVNGARIDQELAMFIIDTLSGLA